MSAAKKPRVYVRYSSLERVWLVAYARRVGFKPGTRTVDHAWDTIGKDFERRFGRKVHAGRLAFQARTLWKKRDGVRYGTSTL